MELVRVGKFTMIVRWKEGTEPSQIAKFISEHTVTEIVEWKGRHFGGIVCAPKPRSVSLVRPIGKSLYSVPRYLTPFRNPREPVRTVPVHCDIVLKEYQKPIYESLVTQLRNNQGACLSCRPGFGKTILTIKLIAELGVSTLILVHRSGIKKYWIEQIKQHTGLDSNKSDSLIHVETVQSVVSKVSKVTKVFKGESDVASSSRSLRTPDFLIVDEVHNIAAKQFFLSITKCIRMPIWTLGLSATIERPDGMHPLFLAYMGPVLQLATTNKKTKLAYRRLYIHSAVHYTSDLYAKKISELEAYKPRADVILDTLLNVMHDKQVIVLASRCAFLDYLAEQLDKKGVKYTCNYGHRVNYLERANGIILATYSMAGESFNVIDLDCLIMASSIKTSKQIIQATGRINRGDSNDTKMIIDVIDDLNAHHAYKRRNIICEQFHVVSSRSKTVSV